MNVDHDCLSLIYQGFQKRGKAQQWLLFGYIYWRQSVGYFIFLQDHVYQDGAQVVGSFNNLKYFRGIEEM